MNIVRYSRTLPHSRGVLVDLVVVPKSLNKYRKVRPYRYRVIGKLNLGHPPAIEYRPGGRLRTGMYACAMYNRSVYLLVLASPIKYNDLDRLGVVDGDIGS